MTADPEQLKYVMHAVLLKAEQSGTGNAILKCSLLVGN